MKKLLSLLLVFVMLMTLVPACVFAAALSPVDIGDTYADEYADLTALAATYPAALEVSKNEVDDITIKLLSDVTGRIEFAIPNSNYILDANGKTFSGGEQNEAISLVNGTNCTLYVVGNGTFTSGRNNTFFVGTRGSLFVQSATISGKINNWFLAQAIRAEGKPCFSMKINDEDPVIYTLAQDLDCGETDTIVITPLDAIPHSHPVCGDSECEDSHGDIEWTEWTSTTSLPTTSGNYYLANDVTVSGAHNIEGANINLCLNGHKIDRNNDNGIFALKNGATLSVCDCRGTGTIGGVGGPICFSQSNATFNFYSGTLASDTRNTIAVTTDYDGANNTINIYGGNVEADELPSIAVKNETINLYGGKLSTSNHNGVLVSQGSYLNLCGNPIITGSDLTDNTKNNDIKTYAADAIDATGYTGDTLTVYYAKTDRQVGDVVIMNVTDETASKFVLSEANDGYMLKRVENNLVYAGEPDNTPADLPDAVNENGPDYIWISNIKLENGDYLASDDATEASENYTNGTPYVAVYKNGILYLNNINIENNADGQSSDNKDHAIYWEAAENDDLVIELIEGTTNNVSDGKWSAINGATHGGIYCPSLTIQGSGTFNVSSAGNAIWVWENITIQNGATVNVTCGDTGISNNESRGTIMIKAGTNLTISGGDYGVKTDGYDTGSFYVEGGTLAIAGNTSAVYSINCDFGNIPVYVSNDVSGANKTLWDGTTDITSYKYISLSGVRTEVYTITFDANGGAGTMADATNVSGEYTLPNCDFIAPNGKQFKAWSVDDSEKAVGDTITVTANTTVTAVWENIPVTTYTVTFDANGGSVTSANSTTTADGKLATLPTPTRNGRYIFKGWYTAASGGTQVTLDKVYTENTTIYAQWTYTGSTGGGVSRYTVKFDTNGGTTVANKTVTRNAKLAEPTAPTKDGYTFDGWYTDKELTTAYDFDAKVTKGFTLYAKWVEAKATHVCLSEKFSDLDTTKWYHEDIDYVLDNEIMLGTSDTVFAPEGSLTRGMLVTILYRSEGEPATNRSIPFADVDMGAYYANATTWAKQNGIINGISETEFAPDMNVTREQLATVMFRYAQFKGMDAVTAEENLGFNDASDISDWAVAAMNWGVGRDYIFSRTEGDIAPKVAAARAEIAAFIHRYIVDTAK